jgi:CopG family transcriptional regulator, nickel-responsive regulator
MSDLVRVSVSLEKQLLDKLETLIEESEYQNRSEFVRDMIREQLVQRQWQGDEETVGTLTLIYDHQQRELSRKLTSIQHDHHDYILAATHVHLDHHLCAEAIIMKGPAKVLKHLADQLKQQKGVLHAVLAGGSTGKGLH